jgi:hypothetical protein
MKKINYISFAFAAVMAVAAGCSTENLTDNTQSASQSGKKITISAGMNEMPTSRVNYNYSSDNSSLAAEWTSADILDVYTNTISAATKGTGFSSPTINDKHNATFNGTLAGTLTSTTPLYAFVEKSGTFIDETAGTDSVDLSKQSGTLEDAERYNILTASATNSEHILFKFSHKLAILKINLSLPGVTESKEAAITLSSDAGLYNNVIINGTDYSLSKSTLGFITTSSNITFDANGKATVYFCIYPGKITNLVVSVDVKDGLRYRSTIGTGTLEANKFYSVSKEAYVGAFYNNDGTYSIAPSAKTIGIICSDTPSAKDIANGWKRGYVLALKNAGNFVSWSANSRIEFSESEFVTTLAQKMNDRDGYTHTKTIKDKYGVMMETQYVAFNTALKYSVAAPTSTTSNPNSGWYLPSIGQWKDILWNLGRVIYLTDDGNGVGTWNYARAALANINAYISAAITGGATGEAIDSSNNSWPVLSSELTADNTVIIFFRTGNNCIYFGFNYPKGQANAFGYVRDILAF